MPGKAGRVKDADGEYGLRLEIRIQSSDLRTSLFQIFGSEGKTEFLDIDQNAPSRT